MHKSLLILEEAILSNNDSGVTDYLSEIDRKTARFALRQTGEHFDIPTLDIGGICYAYLSRASQVLGYANESGLRRLMDRYQIQTPKIGWFVHDVRTRIRETFHLNPKDGSATLLTWEGWLVAGMYGKNEAAREVKIYLLQMERAARVDLGSKDDFGRSLKKTAQLIQLINAARKTKDANHLELLNLEIQAISGRQFPSSAQMALHYK